MTLGGAIVGRDAGVSGALLRPFWAELLALVAGSILGVYLAARHLGSVSIAAVERWTLSALVVTGTALVCVTVLPQHVPGLPGGLPVRVPAGVALGLLIGAVSSVRSISGGELLIPALVLAFGIDVKLAGTAGAVISFPIVLVSLVRHARTGTFQREREYREVAVPMGVGSALGAVTGGYLVARVDSPWLTLLLGAVLIVSAVRSFQDRPEE